MNKEQKNINIFNKNIYQKYEKIIKGRNEKKLEPIFNFNEYLNTLNYYKNKDKFREKQKKIFFTNEEINAHINSNSIKAKNIFNKKYLSTKHKELKIYNINELNNTNLLKLKNLKIKNKHKLYINVKTNINTISHINSNLSINKVNFNISSTYNKDDNPYNLTDLKNKNKKIRFQNYNKYNINQRKKYKMKKSYSTEKNINLNLDKIKSNIKSNDYFSIFHLKRNNKKKIKYNNAKSQIKINNKISQKSIKSLNGNNIFDNIANKLENSLNIKIKLNNILQRTNSKNMNFILKKNY